MTEPTQQQIQELRNVFLKDLESKGEAAIHSSDLQRIKGGDDWLRRFLLHNECEQNQTLNMLWETVQWRKDFKTNEIDETNVKMEYLIEGSFFSHSRDKDGCALLIFKCKKHVKGARNADELKRCVVYWMERLERQENGKPITIFFDMDGCGLSNMDLDFTKYLIGLFKLYYPYFLNYIIILEMAWILNAAFKVIKSLLPEKAVQKIKMLKKVDLKDYIPIEQQLQCWGGTDDFVYSFVPEATDSQTSINTPSNKKVHFADGSPMSESSVADGDRDHEGSVLSVRPSNVITFVREGNDLISTLELQNTDPSIQISYKMKTTSPEKFRVRPSAGCLAPGGRVTVSVTLLHGFQLGGLSRDKFLVMSMPVESVDLSAQEVIDLWKNTSGKSVTQHRLGCTQTGELIKNGTVSTGLSDSESQLNKLSSSLMIMSECNAKLHTAIQRTQLLQFITIGFTVMLGVALIYILRSDANYSASQSCYKDTP